MSKVHIEERPGVEALEVVIINFKSDIVEEYGSFIATLESNEYRSKTKKLEFDVKHHESTLARHSIEKALKLEPKVLPPHLRYLFFGTDDTLLVIIATYFNVQQVECLVDVLKRFKRAFGLTIVHIVGIPLVFVHTKSNSCPIRSQVFIIRDSLIHPCKK